MKSKKAQCSLCRQPLSRAIYVVLTRAVCRHYAIGEVQVALLRGTDDPSLLYTCCDSGTISWDVS